MAKTVNKREPRPVRPTMLDAITSSTRQSNAHLSSDNIQGKRDLIQFKIGQIDCEIINHKTSLAKAEAERKVLIAQDLGFGLVLERR